MKLQLSNVGLVLAIVVLCAATALFAQQPPPARDFDAEIRAALSSAKDAAAFDFTGTLARICLLPQSGGENASDSLPGYITKPASAPARQTWYAEPAKVFDNLYFVGGKVHSAWALTTPEGIILIDTIYPYNSEELIVGGLKKLGLDAANIKYVLISHAHGDHIGGAEMLQERFGPRVVMGAPDWASVEKYPNRYKTMAPKRDIVATDGMKITLGGTTVTTWLTPGHTPGTLSYTFTVMDRGKPVNVAYSGGTAFNFVNNTPDPGHQEFPDLHRLAAAHGREGGRNRRHGHPVEPFGVRQRGPQEPDARRPCERSAPVRDRGRRGAALFPRHAGVRQGRADRIGAAVGRTSEAVGIRVQSPKSKAQSLESPVSKVLKEVSMRSAYLATAVLAAVLWIGSAAVAQTPGTPPGGLVLNPIVATSGTGVSNAALINRDEVRVLRVDVAPNGVRNVHSHDDMQYHLFVPTSGGMQFEAEPDKPVDVAAWQAQFVKGGTKHGFRNTSKSTVTIMEVFVKK